MLLQLSLLCFHRKSRVLTLVVSHGQNSLDLSNSTLDEIDEQHERVRTLQDLYVSTESAPCSIPL